MKNSTLLSIVIACILVTCAGIGIVLSTNTPAPANLQGTGIDAIRGSSNTYTAHMASSGVSQVVAARDGRVGLRIENTGGGAADVRVYLQSTSTGATAASGIRLAEKEEYVPDFVWEGEVWVITTTGTSTVVVQETTP